MLPTHGSSREQHFVTRIRVKGEAMRSIGAGDEDPYGRQSRRVVGGFLRMT